MVNTYKLAGEHIGVITPYNAQVDEINKLLKLNQLNKDSSYGNSDYIEVSTVDGFQGREKEVILISTVRSNIAQKIGFL